MFDSLCLHDLTRSNLEAAVQASVNVILYGEKSLGKSLAGRELAAAILGAPMERLGYHPDYHSLQPVNGVISLEAVQDLCNRGSFCPIEASCRVFLIDDANLMTMGAQNAFLKFLEEAAGHCRCIFIAHEELIPTIRSRCEVVKFQKPSCFRDWLNGNVEELAFLLADGVPGVYYKLVEEKEFLQEAGRLIAGWSSGKEKAELLSDFHLMKEKDDDMLLDRFGAEYVVCFLKSLRSIFLNLLEMLVDGAPPVDSPVIQYSALSKRYSITDIVGRLDMIRSQIALLGMKGKYTRNDFFDFVIGL